MMAQKTQSVLLAIVAFVSGLLIMYVALLSSFSSLEVSLSEIQLDASYTGEDQMETLKQHLFTSHTDSIPCNKASHNMCNLTIDLNQGDLLTQQFSWDAVQQMRRHIIQQTCDVMNRPGNLTSSDISDILSDNDNIFIDDIHNTFFCAIPKAACSSWKTVLAVLSGKLSGRTIPKHVHARNFMKHVGLNSPKDIHELHLYLATQNYTKIIVVRHPFERLISAYRDKFQTHNKWTNQFQYKYGRKIVFLYRGDGVTKHSLLHGDDVTFNEFLTYIVDESVPYSERINPHWDTYHHLCHPCIIPYNHIIKFETLDEDNAVVLDRQFNVRNATEFFPRRNMKEIPSRDITTEYFSKIPESLIYKIYEFYRLDMELFGYKLPQSILSSTKQSQ